MRSIALAAALACLTAWGAPAWASPYPLDQILPQPAVAKLARAKVSTSGALLQRAATARQRATLAKASGLKPAALLKWARMCDLLRIKGVGPKMVRLLLAGRVHTVKQLKSQKAAKLYAQLMTVNKKQKITENPPSQQQLAAWIKQATSLKLVLR